MMAKRLETPSVSDAGDGDQVTAETAAVSAFVLRHAPGVDPARVLQRLWPLRPPTRAEQLDDIDAELQLGDPVPLARWNLVLVTDSEDLTVTLSSELARAGFQRPRASVRPVEADVITCGDVPPLVPSLLAWVLAQHELRSVDVQQRRGQSQRLTIQLRDPRFQGAALLRNGVVEIRSDTLASGRAFANLCEAQGFRQVRLRCRDPVIEPGGLWSPGVLARDPAIRARMADLVARVAPAMECIESDADAPALVVFPSLQRAHGEPHTARDHAASRLPSMPISDALTELSRRIAGDAGRLRLQLRTTSEAHRAALEAPLSATPFGAFRIVHSPETTNDIAYGGAPQHVIDTLVRVVASHTGIVCAHHKVWDDDIDSVWIHLASTGPTELAPPVSAALDLPSLFGEREGDTVRVADLHVPAQVLETASYPAQPHLEAPLAEALYAAARAIQRGTPFLLRGRHDGGRRAIIHTLAHHTGHRVVEGDDAEALDAAQARGDWLLMMDPPAERPAWLASALEAPRRASGLRLLGIADIDWPGRWPAEHTMRTPTVHDVHDLLAAWVWSVPPVVTLAGHCYRAGAPGYALRSALASASNAQALLGALAALYAALQAEPLRFGRRRLAALVDALLDGAPGAIQDALARFVVGRFETIERSRISELALAAGIGMET